MVIDQAYIQTVLNDLGSEDKSVSDAALQTLHDIKDVALPVLKVMLGQALDNGDWGLQVTTAYWFAELGKSAAADTLLDVLHDDRFVRRPFLLFSLGATGDIRVIPALLEAMADGSNLDWEYGQKALDRIGDAGTVPIVEAFYAGNGSIRKSAVNWLGFCCPNHPRTLPVLIEALRDKDSGVRVEAALTLGRQYSQEAVLALLTAVEDSDRKVREEVFLSLGRLDSLTAIKTLLDLSKHADEEISAQAVKMVCSPLYHSTGRFTRALNGTPSEKQLVFGYVESLTSPDDIRAYLTDTTVIAHGRRVCDIAARALEVFKEVNTRSGTIAEMMLRLYPQ